LISLLFFFLMIRRPPRSTRTDTLFPYTTLCRSQRRPVGRPYRGARPGDWAAPFHLVVRPLPAGARRRQWQGSQQQLNQGVNMMRTTTNLPLRLRTLCGATALAGALLAGAPLHAATVTAVMQSGLRVMDPILSTAFLTRDHAYMIYDTLLGVDSDFKIQPQMASRSEEHT